MAIKVQGTTVITDSLKIENVDIEYDNTQNDLIATTLQGAVDELAGADSTPVAAIQYFGMDSVPSGWLKANGAQVSRTTYSDLFAEIGTTFGAGDGSTTFNLPDLRGEFIRGWDDGRGVDAGRSFGSTQGHAFSSHTHGVSHNAQRWFGNRGSSSVTNNPAGSDVTIGFANASINTNSAGSDETRPRNVALLPCIKF